MKIGYILRKHNARTQISGDCFSSCFLIFVAGVERYIRYYRDYKSKKIISGRIGIHRPYFDSKTPNLIITKTEYDKMLIDLKKYFSDMNISLSVYDIMINTPPESLKFYDIDTIGNILPEKDPYYAEKEVFLGSWEYGISTHEYRNLSSKFEKTCLLSNQIINFNELLPTNVFLPIDVCKDIIFYNITPSQSLERRKILEWECNIKEFFTDKELESFKPLADEEKILNLSYRKLRSCMNSIMKTGKKIITEN